MSADGDARDATLQALVRRHSNETPSAVLDAEILAAAHEAVIHEPVRRSAAWRIWMPLAAAASIAAVLIGEAPRAPMVNSERAIVTDVPEKRDVDHTGQVSAAAESASATQQPPAQTNEAPSRLQALTKSERAPAAVPAKPPPGDDRRQLSISRDLDGQRRADAPANADATSSITSARKEAGASPAAPAPNAMGEPARTSAPARQAMALPATPADWIARIRALRSAGNDAEAARELARFREAYADADTRLPEDLRAWAAARR